MLTAVGRGEGAGREGVEREGGRGEAEVGGDHGRPCPRTPGHPS